MHQHHEGLPNKCVDLGNGACLQETVHGTDENGEGGHLAGYIFGHDIAPGTATQGEAAERIAQGFRCQGGVNIDAHFENRPCWTQTGSLKGGNLTLNPSIRCVNHEFHGWVRDGKWVPA